MRHMIGLKDGKTFIIESDTWSISANDYLHVKRNGESVFCVAPGEWVYIQEVGVGD